MQTIRTFRSFNRPVQVLLANFLLNNVAFYMLVPFLAGYLADDLGFAAWTVGLVLGLRVLSQQGLFLIGGSVADRVGCKPAIVAGFALRVIGFGMFGFVDSVAGMVVASVVGGLGGALMLPAIRSYLVQEAGERQVEAFALFEVAVSAGSLIGPLIGSLLIGVEFRLVALTSAGLFLALALVQFAFLPARDVDAGATNQTIFGDWREVAANRAFMLFSLSMLGNFALYNQVYLGLPLEVRRLTGGDAGVGLLFAVLAVLGIVGQIPVTSWSKVHLRPPAAISIGMVLIGLAFAPLALRASVLPIDAATVRGRLDVPDIAGLDGAYLVAQATNFAPLLLSAASLAIGMMVSSPFTAGTIALLARGRLVGTYFGMYSVGQGIGATLGTMAGGAAFDIAAAVGWAGLPWVLMVAIGLASATGVAALDRRGLLGEPPRRAVVSPA
ncbi:MAG: MFS transporter [Chloroflexota bacterium]|nr:MFS transporter [Chloroflexota bacterium]